MVNVCSSIKQYLKKKAEISKDRERNRQEKMKEKIKTNVVRHNEIDIYMHLKIINNLYLLFLLSSKPSKALTLINVISSAVKSFSSAIYVGHSIFVNNVERAKEKWIIGVG